MNWVDFLTDAAGILKVYGGSPPPLDRVSIHRVLIDRDGPTVGLSLDLPRYPENPPAKWASQGFNTVAIELTLFGVEELEMRGVATDIIADIRMDRLDENLVSLVVKSDTVRISVVTAVVAIGKITAYQSE